ncbi:MAG: hypothetical protein VXZ82_18415 [Planctomycetota bacterium]|nr:hypothetical protein [Planctomycetota bacterium]
MQFKSFIMIPIMVNNVTTFSLIPICDQFRLGDVRLSTLRTAPRHRDFTEDDKAQFRLSDPCCRLPRELKQKKRQPSKEHKLYFEAYYYATIQSRSDN